MGCGCLSKMANSDLVNLCRKRKKFIKAAKNLRFALASAHIVYFLSFLNVGNSLCQLVEDELVASVEWAPTTDSDNQSAGKGSSHLEFSSLESDTDVGSLTDYVHEGSDLSEPAPEDGYNVKKLSEDITSGIYDQPQVVDTAAQLFPTNKVTQYPPWYGNGVPYGGHMSFLPNDPMFFPYGNVGFSGGAMPFSSIDPRFSHNGNGPSFGGLANSPPVNLNFCHQRNDVPFGGHMNLPRANPNFNLNGGGVSFDDHANLVPNNIRIPLDENAIISGGPMNLPYNSFKLDRDAMGAGLHPNAFKFAINGTGVPYGGMLDFLSNNTHHSTIRSPSPPEAPTWDYLNPFAAFNDTYPRYYVDRKYETDFSSNCSNLSEVREREGIPDLESEAEDGSIEEQQDGIESEAKDKGKTDEGSSEAVPLQGVSVDGPSGTVPLKGGSGEGTSEENPQKNSEDAFFAEKEDPESHEKEANYDFHRSGCLEEEAGNKSRETVEIQETVKHDAGSPMQVNSTSNDTHGSRDLKEVVMEIRDAFEAAFAYGEDVSVVLETGKIQFRPRSAISKAKCPLDSSVIGGIGGHCFNGILRAVTLHTYCQRLVFSSWILSVLAPSNAASYCPAHSKSKQVALGAENKARSVGGSIVKDVCMNANLSSALEKLYMWEKKLYMQVKEEERLRVIYDKECKRLKILDERGAESRKIDATSDSVKRLLQKIKVVVSTIDAISRRIHKLRDEELHPQLNELIHRLEGMWKSIVECHRKQFRAIMEARTDVRIAKEGFEGNSTVKATQKLEKDILNWATCFTDWLNTQKAFVKFLNGWLTKCLFHEPEDTLDGIAPFSPRRLGAPPICIIVNAWLHAIENVSESDLLKAMRDFAFMLHQLQKKLIEERHQRLKVEYLSKDLVEIRTLNEESGTNWDQFMSSNNTEESEDISENAVPIPGRVYVKFETMRNRLNEEKAKHEETIKQVDDAASQGFQAGLIRIFKALDTFSLDMLKAYEKVRIRSVEVQLEV